MKRARAELLLAAVFAVLAVATAIWPTWIESLTGLEPDAGSGALEWALVVVFGVLALVAWAQSRRHTRAATAG